MKISLKFVIVFLGALSMFDFDVPSVAAESHASSEAPMIIRQRRGAWRRIQKQQRREEAAKKREHDRFEQDHKMRFQKENQARSQRLNRGKRHMKNFKWKKKRNI